MTAGPTAEGMLPSKPGCTEPALGERLPPAGEASARGLPPEVREHMQSCLGCALEMRVLENLEQHAVELAANRRNRIRRAITRGAADSC